MSLIRVAVVTKESGYKCHHRFDVGDIVFCKYEDKDIPHDGWNELRKFRAWQRFSKDFNKKPHIDDAGGISLKQSIQTVIDLDNCKEDPTLGAFILMVEAYLIKNDTLVSTELHDVGLGGSYVETAKIKNLILLKHLYKTGSLPDSDIEFLGQKFSKESAEKMLKELEKKLNK